MAHILIIDDDRSLLELLSGYLEQQGYEVTVAPSGQTGLTVFSEAGADLVLLDVTMPGSMAGRCWPGCERRRTSPSSC